MTVHGSYDPVLVVLSVTIAIFASFTALNLAGRLSMADKSARPWWLLSGALALGGGIWSMHFVGMLAFVMPMPVAYDVRLTLFSLLLPILVTGIGLHIVSRLGTNWRSVFAGGLLVGLGVVVMHYSGMAAMRMPGVATTYNPLLFAASVAIALVAATAALWLAFQARGTGQRLAAAVVMGIAIAGMHYTAMAAAIFTMDDQTAITIHHPVIQTGVLAVAVISASSILLLLALLTAFFDRKLATLTAREAAALQQSEERYRSLIENGSDIIAILDHEGTFTYESSSARHVLGYGMEDIVGRRLTDFVPTDNVADVQRFLGQVLEQSGAPIAIELRLRHHAGSWRDFEAVGKNLLHEAAIAGVVVNLRDITERKQLIAQLELLSETDFLTGTLNRRGFLKLAERELERMRRTGQMLTIVMIDIDHFKQVNDTYGHAAGDLVLAMISNQCRQLIRNVDLLARLGGEEFVILPIDGASEAVHDIIARLGKAISVARISTIKGDVSVTASFGMATIDPKKHDLETALRLADEALYAAKNAGRNCVKTRALS